LPSDDFNVRAQRGCCDASCCHEDVISMYADTIKPQFNPTNTFTSKTSPTNTNKTHHVQRFRSQPGTFNCNTKLPSNLQSITTNTTVTRLSKTPASPTARTSPKSPPSTSPPRTHPSTTRSAPRTTPPTPPSRPCRRRLCPRLASPVTARTPSTTTTSTPRRVAMRALKRLMMLWDWTIMI
jgi:hypothetical protein